jgi:hypothetical protein
MADMAGWARSDVRGRYELEVDDCSERTKY